MSPEGPMTADSLSGTAAAAGVATAAAGVPKGGRGEGLGKAAALLFFTVEATSPLTL